MAPDKRCIYFSSPRNICEDSFEAPWYVSMFCLQGSRSSIFGPKFGPIPNAKKYVQNKPLVCSIGCPCSHLLFPFSVLHSNKTVNKITY